MARTKNDKTPAKAGADCGATKKRRTNPFQYLQEVRNEARKVTWTPRNELIVSTVMVLILATIAMLFFWGLDTLIQATVTWLLSLGS